MNIEFEQPLFRFYTIDYTKLLSQNHSIKLAVIQYTNIQHIAILWNKAIKFLIK